MSVKEPREPARSARLGDLERAFEQQLQRVMVGMKVWGYDPVVFETYRSQERQDWLYGIGRTHHLKRKPVTWTRRSQHTKREAADVISAKKGWSDVKFFRALRYWCRKYGLTTLDRDRCHVQFAGRR